MKKCSSSLLHPLFKEHSSPEQGQLDLERVQSLKGRVIVLTGLGVIDKTYFY